MKQATMHIHLLFKDHTAAGVHLAMYILGDYNLCHIVDICKCNLLDSVDVFVEKELSKMQLTYCTESYYKNYT